MDAHWIWWALAVALLAAELATGTFYLLVIALGGLAGGLTAFAGGSLTAQLLVAAIAAIGGWAALRRRRPARDAGSGAGLLDIGQEVEVAQWLPGGHARVRHRGAEWQARLEPGGPSDPQPGRHVIRAIDGSQLVLGRLPARPPGPDARQE